MIKLKLRESNDIWDVELCLCVGIKCDRLNAYGVTARVVFSLSLSFLKKRRKRNETPTHNGSTAIKSNELEQMEQKLNNDFFAHSRKTIHLRFTESSSDSKIKAKKRGNYLGNSIYSFQFVTYKCVRAFSA